MHHRATESNVFGPVFHLHNKNIVGQLEKTTKAEVHEAGAPPLHQVKSKQVCRTTVPSAGHKRNVSMTFFFFFLNSCFER